MVAMLLTIMILLVAFQLKHYLVDYNLQFKQSDSMRKFDLTGWAWPLFKHAGQHAIASAIIAGLTLYFHSYGISIEVFTVVGLILLFDLIVHFTMDRIKASPNMLGKYKLPTQAWFKALALDQAVHHLTHYAIIGALVYYIYI